MRVLHVSSYFAPAYTYGGPPRTILGLCRALKGEGVDIEVFTTTANGDEELPASANGALLIDGIPVRYFPRAAPRRFFGASGMREALRREVSSFDLVHVHGVWNVPGWLAVGACRKKVIPYVVSPRGMLDEGSLGHHRIRKALCYQLRERRNLSGASFLHATSFREVESFERLKIGPEVVLLPNGIADPAAVDSFGFRARWRLPREARLVVFLGRLHPTKRLDLLVAAFRRLERSVFDSILVIAGRKDGVDPESLGLGSRARWLGEIDEQEKWRLLSEAAALVQCSDSESFGLSVLEALAAGVPVVVTRTCPWEEVETEGCGFWVPQDAESIAVGLKQILSNSERAQRMGEKGRGLVSKRYRWPVIGREMARCYERARARGSGS